MGVQVLGFSSGFQGSGFRFQGSGFRFWVRVWGSGLQGSGL